MIYLPKNPPTHAMGRGFFRVQMVWPLPVPQHNPSHDPHGWPQPVTIPSRGRSAILGTLRLQIGRCHSCRSCRPWSSLRYERPITNACGQIAILILSSNFMTNHAKLSICSQAPDMSTPHTPLAPPHTYGGAPNDDEKCSRHRRVSCF